MGAPMTLKLANRSPKKPIKKLPDSIQVSPDSTIEEVKIQISKLVQIKDYNRIGLFDPDTKKTFKNRQARISDEPVIFQGGLVLVKDLGPQMGWRTVYVIEYIGPLLFHTLALYLRPYIYKGAPAPFDLSQSQWLVLAMFQLHFLKREYETIFVHRFSANTMPFFNVFKNSAFYWLVAGIVCAYSIYSPTSMTAKADQPIVDAIGLVLYLIGEVATLLIHSYLSTLRTPGTTERKIPVGYGFSLVTCPNYMFEVIAWMGIILASRDWTVIVFIAIGIAQMRSWAAGKERAYRKEFGDRYKKKRYTMLPGLF